MNCNYCEFRCNLSEGSGICGRYGLQNGEVKELEPMRFVPPAFYEVEEIPFFHALPGKFVMQIGTKSCNAACDYCMNSHIAIDEITTELSLFSAEKLVSHAKANSAKAIIFGINEVTCYMQSAIEVAKAAHAAGLKVGCLTNGYESQECIELIADHMDFVNVSLKSMDNDFYRENLGLPSVAPVLRNIEYLAKRTHLEVTTPLASELTREKLLGISGFLSGINKNIPWHLLKLQPANKRMELQDLNMGEVISVIDEAKKMLPYIYLGGLAASRWVNTVCPNCGRRLIKRVCIGACGSRFGNMEFDGKVCPECGTEIPIIGG